MVVTVDVNHIYKYPIHLVVQTHFTKYPNVREKAVQRMEVLEHEVDLKTGIDYRRRVAICENVVPALLRKLHFLNEDNVLLEEEAWLTTSTGCLRLQSRNLTWTKYADMREESTFVPCDHNPAWTQFSQHGVIRVKGLGPFAKPLELFAKQFLKAGAMRSVSIMEELLRGQSTAQTSKASVVS